MPRTTASFLVSFVAGASVLAGCAPGGVPEAEPTAEATAAVTVAEAVQGTCVTTAVEALARQLVAQGNCTTPGAFVAVPERPNVAFADTVFPYLQQAARDALVGAVDATPSTSLQVKAMLHTVVQQYLLRSWAESGTCGIAAADPPGKSPHASGLTVDIEDQALWRPTLEAGGFAWQGAGNPGRFTYAGAGAADNTGLDVRAFQQLWNINHPDDLIDEDGLYGPQTEGRVVQSPADGFPLGASCGAGGSGSGGTGGSGGQASSGSGAVGGAGGSGGQGSAGGGGGDDGGGGNGTTTPAQSGCSFPAPRETDTPPPLPLTALGLLVAAALARPRRPRSPRPRAGI